ncbi:MULTISPECIES: hypothetical protein [unclassified Crossiella]|uniref:DUF4760 domain-containing protein n=1 Tax=unclassified Crossiella TaxID=2620835 RepID=UPI001FFEE536|nr:MULTISPECIES: hypothetical protein [unclassified Crossiella]MCK2241594.1 hypothetical protein [Crossiella sp. S99.2]MCK2255534.1 hypothetical protein [Crossiella sp. S99.1]
MALSVWLSLLSPVVALLIAFWGFRRSTRADRLRAFFDLHERYLSAEVRAGRRILHQRVAGRSAAELAELDRDSLDRIGYTLAVLNSIAIACAGGYVDRRLVRRSMGRSYAGAIAAAQPYIDRVEALRGFRPYPFAESLAEQLREGAHVEPRD